MPYTDKSLAKRQAVIGYFEDLKRWITASEIANYLGCSVQNVRYYLNQLTNSDYLEVSYQKVKGNDGIWRIAYHYRKNRSVKKLSA